METTTKINPSSQARIERFVDQFIRSNYVANWTAGKDSDFWNEPNARNVAPTLRNTAPTGKLMRK